MHASHVTPPFLTGDEIEFQSNTDPRQVSLHFRIITRVMVDNKKSGWDTDWRRHQVFESFSTTNYTRCRDKLVMLHSSLPVATRTLASLPEFILASPIIVKTCLQQTWHEMDTMTCSQISKNIKRKECESSVLLDCQTKITDWDCFPRTIVFTLPLVSLAFFTHS